MAEIYSNASQVLAFLGPGTLPKAWMLCEVLDYLDKTSRTRTVFRGSDRRDSVVPFLGLPYFDRVWVLQEIALAKLVVLVVGDRQIHWTSATVSKLLDLCSSLHIDPPSALHWVPASQPDHGDLLDVLQRCRNCSVCYLQPGQRDLKSNTPAVSAPRVFQTQRL